MTKLFSYLGSLSGFLIGSGLTLMLILSGTGSHGVMCELNCDDIVYPPRWSTLMFQGGLVFMAVIFAISIQIEKGRDKVLADQVVTAVLPSVIIGFFITILGAILVGSFKFLMYMLSLSPK